MHLGSHFEESLAVLDRLPIFTADLNNCTVHLSLDFIHYLHCFDDANNRFRINLVANLDKGCCIRTRSHIKCANDGGLDQLEARIDRCRC